MGRGGTHEVSSCRGSWAWSWRNRSCAEWVEGSTNGTVSCSGDHDGGTHDVGGVCVDKARRWISIGQEIEVVRGR